VIHLTDKSSDQQLKHPNWTPPKWITKSQDEQDIKRSDENACPELQIWKEQA
jgi:hypothetical protein